MEKKNYFDLHKTLVLYIGFGILAALALILRYKLLRFQSEDYILDLSPWFDFLKTHGAYGLKTNFSNYNLPYLYALYIGTLLPIPKIVFIKGISILFDLVMACGVFLVVRRFNPKNYAPFLAALITLFLPTVFMNGAMWAQSDSIYTAFLIFSFYFLLDKRFTLMWLMWTLAFIFKLQAVFFLPVLLIAGLRYRLWLQSWISIPVLVFVSIPGILVGRPVFSVLTVYTSQVGFYQQLTMHAANLYQWLPNQLFSLFNPLGVIVTAALMVFIALLVYYREFFGDKELLLVATLILLVVPYFLPQMHERYFYPAEIFVLITAFVYRRMIWYVPLLQFVTLCAYTPFLFNIPPVLPLGVVAIFTLIIICHLAYELFISGHILPSKPDKTTRTVPRRNKDKKYLTYESVKAFLAS